MTASYTRATSDTGVVHAVQRLGTEGNPSATGETSPPTSRRRWASKLRAIGGCLVLALVGLELAYLLAANLVLAGPGLRGGVGGPAEIFAVEYRSAYSLLPGVVHVRGLHLRAQDATAQWTLDAQRLRVRLGLWPLSRRVVALSGIRTSGVVVRIRRKLDPLEVTPETTRMLPPIRGYSDPPLRIAGAPTAPAPPDELWTVELADVDARLRELWLQEVRVEGDARLTARHLTGLAVDARDGLRIGIGGQSFALGRSTLAIRTGVVHLGADTVTRRLRGRAVVSVTRFDLGADLDAKLFRFISGRVHLQGDVTHLSASNHYLPEASGLRVHSGEGDFDAALVVQRGVLRAGSRVTSEIRELAASLGDMELRTNVASRLGVGAGGDAVASVHLTRVRLRPRGSPGAPMWSDHVGLEARARNLALWSPSSGATLSLSVPHARLPDVASLAPPWGLAGELRIDDLRAHLSTSTWAGTASGRLAMNRFVVARDDARVFGGWRSDVHLSSMDLAGRTGRGAAAVELHDVRMGRGRGDAPLSGRVDASSIEIDSTGVTVGSTFGLRQADGVAEAILERLDLPLPGFVADWLDHRRVQGVATVTLGPRALLALSGLDLRGDNYRLQGRLRLGGGPPEGRFLIESGPLSVGVGLSRGATEVVVFGSTAWFRGRRPQVPRTPRRRVARR